ncbi:hypothetical protein K450DRAFT_263927 [Umbelopsis ramanniana AG]|uniref:Uncharacterized protein n=1 Tax=Umbelopsis ramanniana AG TaxID=1314678 RepID=A0AAD5DZU4_UMBRA|nr:uncharacterized protein K450DRAFT_263927 [Umbelopsis ramanniana AG]KAI8574973.1 hypothetical protein K450DRAFT_263927 [Umbelopsis ramanniana AG]
MCPVRTCGSFFIRPRRNESIYRKTTLCSPKRKTIDLPSCNITPTALAVGALVPTANLNGDRTSSSPRPQNADNVKHPFRHLPMDKSRLETFRLETIGKRFEKQDYSPSAIQSLVQAVVHETGPKSPCCHMPSIFFFSGQLGMRSTPTLC